MIVSDDGDVARNQHIIAHNERRLEVKVSPDMHAVTESNRARRRENRAGADREAFSGSPFTSVLDPEYR
jgi:hypothetical protein